jgi:hypothetical protein
MTWRRSSYCETGNCVEVDLEWHKSSHSSESANCVEVAEAELVHVRDSKDPTGPVLRFGRPAWADFIAEVKAGAFG